VAQDDGTAWYTAERKYCNVLQIRQILTDKTAHFVFAMGSPLADIFDRAMRDEAIELQRIRRKYYSTKYGQTENECERMERQMYKPLGRVD
jgi:hypothetical protein